MNISYCDFDPRHSIIRLYRRRAGRINYLTGQSSDREVKMMLLTSTSGTPICLKDVLEELETAAFSADETLIVDKWVSLKSNNGVRFFFLSRQNPTCEVHGELCRYTAFSYILRRNQVEIYDCDSINPVHRAHIDMTMPITYYIKEAMSERRHFLRRTEEVPSGYYKVTISCENTELYKTGYVEYLCGDIPIPLTREIIETGFFVKNQGREPELRTEYREFIELRRGD